MVGVVALVDVLTHFGLGQGDDPGTGHCLLGDVQHLPAWVSVGDALVRPGFGHCREQDRGTASRAGTLAVWPLHPAETNPLGQSPHIQCLFQQQKNLVHPHTDTQPQTGVKP